MENEIRAHLLELKHAVKELPNDQILRALNIMAMSLNRLSSEVRTMKQTVGLVNKRLPVPVGRPVRCLFVLHCALWNVYAPLFKAMREADDFDPIVATICHNDNRNEKNENSATSEEYTHKELSRLSVPHIRLGMADSFQGLEIIKALAPDIIFRQVPYDELYLPGYQTQELSFTRLCYISYSFAMPRRFSASDPAVDSGCAAPFHADKNFHRMCWRFFCETDMHRDMIARASPRAGSNLVSVGYTKFDELLRSAQEDAPIWPIDHNDQKHHFRIIWAPHHSVGREGLGFGMFPDIFWDMLAWAQERPDIDFVFRPHPLALESFVRLGGVSQSDLDVFLLAWGQLPNTARYDNSDYGRLFAASDVMVTDGVGFLSEYQIFQKPLVFMDSQRHVGFNDAGNMVVQSANRVTDVAGVRALCDRLQQGEPDPMREAQEKNLRNIMPYPGRSAERILAAIRAGLAYERGEVVSDTSLLPRIGD